MATLGDGTSILPYDAKALLAVITEQDDYILYRFALKDIGVHMVMVKILIWTLGMQINCTLAP